MTSSPHVYATADFQVRGEAEEIMKDFVAAWERGERSGIFTAEKFQTDVTKTPLARYDLLNLKDYLYVCVQYSRGCPFTCEFCDIIELYGRKPRTKANAQMLAELDRLYELGHRGHVDFVDDNLIGNKKALKTFLPELKAWQEAHNFPFEFSTEASLNLSDDDELLEMLSSAISSRSSSASRARIPKRWSRCARSRIRGATSPSAFRKSTAMEFS